MASSYDRDLNKDKLFELIRHFTSTPLLKKKKMQRKVITSSEFLKYITKFYKLPTVHVQRS